MNKFYIHHHLGLGDHLDCNGMVRCMQKSLGTKVCVFSKSNYYSMIEYMYRDTEDIEVVEILEVGCRVETMTLGASIIFPPI